MSQSIPPRRVTFEWTNVRRHWLDGRPGLTHMCNALHLLFPPAERWFSRVTHQLLPQLTDAELIHAAKGFMGQEGNHARTHQSFASVLRAQGFEVDRIVDFVERDFQRHSRILPLRIQIALISATEQYTAALGRWVFESHVFDGADPELRDLFLWHSAEEIEHKCVAFDVREATTPGYVRRVVPLLFVTAGLVSMWSFIALYLAYQDPETTLGAVVRDLRRARREGKAPFGAIARGFFQYLKPSFHPSEDDDMQYAREYLATSPAVRALAAAPSAAT